MWQEQAEKWIANNPQTFVSGIKLLFAISRAFSEACEPIALQNARNYAMALREQKKIYDSSLSYIKRFPTTYEWASYELNVRHSIKKST